MKEMSWALKQGVRVYPVPVPNSEGKQRPDVTIQVDFRGKIHNLTELYSQSKNKLPILAEAVQDIYKRYYGKNHDSSI